MPEIHSRNDGGAERSPKLRMKRRCELDAAKNGHGPQFNHHSAEMRERNSAEKHPGNIERENFEDERIRIRGLRAFHTGNFEEA